MGSWEGESGNLARHVLKQSQQCLNAYRENPTLVEEHSAIERATAQGGYGRRQIYELVQNGADELFSQGQGRIEVLLSDDALYCANEGDPISENGVNAILGSHMSGKRGNQIGRFGLGFKSVLGVTDAPEFYSRPASFSFDAGLARRRIQEIVPGAEKTPVLRVANLLSPEVERKRDPILSSLMEWATTVVKVPLQQGHHWLAEDLDDFPAEFLLFATHVTELVLTNTASGSQRTLRLNREGSIFHLHDGDTESSWRIFEKVHKLSPAAKADAGELAEREEIPVIWAVPLEGRKGRGRFWAFFPTEFEMLLLGILNAPWKTNEDRQNLLRGEFNTELLDVASKLVVDNLDALRSTDDPGRHLDVMPGRPEEHKGWADLYLNETIFQLAAESPSIPDQEGHLRRPRSLQIHPPGVSREAVEKWGALPSRPKDWCHPSVETRERRPRIERLRGLAGATHYSFPVWLNALAKADTVEASREALLVAELGCRETERYRSELPWCRILKLENGHLTTVDPSKVFLPPEGASGDPGDASRLVHHELALDENVRRALLSFDVRPIDPAARLEALSNEVVSAPSRADWASFWAATRAVDVDSAAHAIGRGTEGKGFVRALSVAGKYRPLPALLLPGPIVRDEDDRDQDALVDSSFHEQDLLLLRRLGCVEVPGREGGSQDEAWFFEYRTEQVANYRRELSKKGKNPAENYIVFRQDRFTGPLEPLQTLSEEGRAIFTQLLLDADPAPEQWTIGHTSQHDRYPDELIDSPAIWMLSRFGRFETALGNVPVSKCVGPTLSAWRALFPIAECSDVSAAALKLPLTFADVQAEGWAEALQLSLSTSDDSLLGRFYGEACRFVDAPSLIRCRVSSGHQNMAPKEVTVTSSRHDFDALTYRAVPVVLADTAQAVERLIERWNLRSSDASVRVEVFSVPDGSESPLIDVFPGLRGILPEELESMQLVPCSILRLDELSDSGRASREVDFALSEGQLHYVPGYLTNRQLLERIVNELGIELLPTQIGDLLAEKESEERKKRMEAVRGAGSLPLKLVEAVGEKPLRQRLPAGLIEAVEERQGLLTPEEVGKLALAVHGVNALKVFREAMEEVDLRPPLQWAGGKQALAFVEELGFPAEFAGFEQQRRRPVEDVEGPPDLPPLHDYQEEIVAAVRGLVQSRTERAMLSLPTGAGKTRVMVQGLIEGISAGDLTKPVLWIAQTDELCEQAVQTWTYVWRAIGSTSTLRVSRLWAGNDAVPYAGTAHIVVATISKMNVCIQKPEYDWLKDVGCLVIDEAHGAISREYTALLEWMDLGRGRTSKPLVGLTATPFRGRSTVETERLVARFGARRLEKEALGDDPYRTLQEKGVLARVHHEELGGAEIDLSAADMDHLKTLGKLPSSVEGWLGANVDRNNVLLESLLAKPETWTMLLFCVSVEHAETMAALLSLEGVPSVAISAGTPSRARRHYIEQFRDSKIRVLTNYGVLTQGFDAPAVRAVYVARPTFSPNVYQQMIGRGLRGPANGGKPECLIVNVADTVREFGQRLAFYDFEYLWKADGSNNGSREHGGTHE